MIYQGLQLIQNRGYDSAGILSVDKEDVRISKALSEETLAILDLEKQRSQHEHFHLALGHTRWATHGQVSLENTHPHCDNKKEFFCIHNGTLENDASLRMFLQKQGIRFYSQTDTELIVNLVAYYFASLHASSSDLISCVNRAIALACKDLRGTWALVIFFRQLPLHLFVLKHRMSLLLGRNQRASSYLMCSESFGFPTFIDSYAALEDNTLLVLESGLQTSTYQMYAFDKQDGEPYLINTEPIFQSWHKDKSLSRGITDRNFTQTEIYEQPQIMQRILEEYRIKLFFRDKKRLAPLLKRKQWILIGTGTSYHATLLSRFYAKKFDPCFPIMSFDAYEFFLDYLESASQDTAFIFFSQSGETKDTINIFHEIQEKGYETVSFTNVPDSFLAQNTTLTFPLLCGREIAVASTKAFTAQVLVFILLSLARKRLIKTESCSQKLPWLAKDSQKLYYDLEQEVYQAHEVLRLDSACQRVAKDLAHHSFCFLLGHHLTYPIAKEAALKIQEMAYVHAEPYLQGALKHGPFALIEPGTWVFFLVSQNSVSCQSWNIEHTKEALSAQIERVMLAAKEVQARKGKVFVVSDIYFSQLTAQEQITVPSSTILCPLWINMVFQLIAYHTALYKGLNPDFPRNLAKVVTVD